MIFLSDPLQLHLQNFTEAHHEQQLQDAQHQLIHQADAGHHVSQVSDSLLQNPDAPGTSGSKPNHASLLQQSIEKTKKSGLPKATKRANPGGEVIPLAFNKLSKVNQFKASFAQNEAEHRERIILRDEAQREEKHKLEMQHLNDMYAIKIKQEKLQQEKLELVVQLLRDKANAKDQEIVVIILIFKGGGG